MIIASIDLMDGKAVQLVQGKEKKITVEEPLKLADEFQFYGEIAVIDLDAAMGKEPQKELIRKILKRGACRVGGGIRDVKTAKEYISWGAKKVIIGSRAFSNDQLDLSFLEELKKSVGRERLILAIDSVQGEIVTQGWKHKTGLNTLDIVNQTEEFFGEYLYTNVEKEGMMKGADFETLREISKRTKNKITLAGGIHTLEEVKKAAELNADIQLGMALYSKELDLGDCFIESLNWEKEKLIPTITQDNKGQVLTLAYSSRESLKKMIETRKTWFFSRSRNQLWMKGESSGNTQEVMQIRADCDRDSLLVKVIPQGPACHTNRYSCFEDFEYSLQELYEVVQQRFENPAPGSYTATLNDQLVREKLMEEAQEVIEAEDFDHITWEAADVLYFLTVLMVKEKVTFKDVLTELYRRRFK